MITLPTFSAVDCRFLGRHVDTRSSFQRLPAADQAYLLDIRTRLQTLARMAVKEYHGRTPLTDFVSPLNPVGLAKGKHWAGVCPRVADEPILPHGPHLQLAMTIMPEGFEISFGRDDNPANQVLPPKRHHRRDQLVVDTDALLRVPIPVIARLERSLPTIWKYRKQRWQPATTNDFSTLSQWLYYASTNMGRRASISMFITAEDLENDKFDAAAMFLEANRLFEPLFAAIYGTHDSAEVVSPEQPVASAELDEPADCDFLRICDDFADALRQANLVLGTDHTEQAKAFVASVATKPFVILTGLSGSGKTQLALRFGDWLGIDRVFVAPVRPDWTGAEALFGYEDALQPMRDGARAWHVPDTLEFLLRAANDPNNPYLLVLDEMNLAHVERYFADFLSGMETGQPCLPNLDYGDDGFYRMVPGGDKRLPMPKNLFVIGTVNIDETTYLFSPKVLDRANTIDFRVRTEDLVTDYKKPGRCRPAPVSLGRGLLELAKNESFHQTNPAPGGAEFATGLRRVHRILSDHNLEFGHRVFYEATRFAALFAACGMTDPYAALDRQILQKVLPRLHGSRRKLETALCALAAECVIPALDGDLLVDAARFNPLAESSSRVRMPLSLAKIQRMVRALRTNQFTSFSE